MSPPKPRFTAIRTGSQPTFKSDRHSVRANPPVQPNMLLVAPMKVAVWLLIFCPGCLSQRFLNGRFNVSPRPFPSKFPKTGGKASDPQRSSGEALKIQLSQATFAALKSQRGSKLDLGQGPFQKDGGLAKPSYHLSTSKIVGRRAQPLCKKTVPTDCCLRVPGALR